MPNQQYSLSRILSESMTDIPAWARAALVLIGLCGVVVIVVMSMLGNQEDTIKVDKLLHFGGYATLAFIFVLGLRPALYLPAMVLLAIVGIAIEYFQPFNARTFDKSDMIANLVGLAAGFAAGLVCRLFARIVQTQRHRSRLNRSRRRFSRGAVIVQQNAQINHCYLIEKGEVQLHRDVDGQRHVLGKLGPGDLFSILGLLQSKPQYATVQAVTDTTVLSLSLDDLQVPAAASNDPSHAVLQALAKQLRILADRVVDAEKIISSSSTG
jgi:CRP-like cAMP-binding protein